MTSPQRRLLPSVLELFRQRDPECAVLLVGSVQRRYERPASDIDLLVIVRDDVQADPAWTQRWEHRGARSFTIHLSGFELCTFFATLSAMERWLTETPFHMYPFSQGEILQDPAGVARRLQSFAQGYFKKHPELAQAWEKQLAAHKQVKLTGVDANGFYRTPEGTLAKYMTLDVFSAHISKLAGSAARGQA